MTSNWNKFVLLLWKNFLIHKRNRWRTCIEIGLPILMFLLVALMPSRPYTIGPYQYQPLRVDGTSIPDSLKRLAYTPNNELFKEIVDKACSTLGIQTCDGFNSSLLMQAAQVNGSYLCGIDFGDHSKRISKLSNATTFTLRFPSKLRFQPPFHFYLKDWNTGHLVSEFSVDDIAPGKDDGGFPSYRKEHFLTVQSAVSRALIGKLAPEVNLPPSMNIRRLPYPNTVDDDWLTKRRYMPQLVGIAFFFFFINTIQYIVTENGRQLKESMELMGLPGWIQWAAWYVELLLQNLIPITTISVMLRVSIFPYSNCFLVWTFLTLYCSAVICFCFLVSVFFNKATKATASLASFLWIVTFIALPVNAPLWEKVIYSLLTNPAMCFGMDNITRLEMARVGLTWRTLFTTTELNNSYTVSISIVMLMSNIVLYFILTIYLEQIMTRKFGMAKPWYFPLTRKFWSASSSKEDDILLEPLERYFEEEHQASVAGVQIRNLQKVYGGGKVAVDGLNLNIYEGQITVLLGHNGAGKTTTMSMLTGMFSPSSGTALINGYDIHRSMDDARTSMGFCPQHNVLFDELTVHEHLEFAARLKGLESDHARSEVDRYINRLGLTEKARAESSTLSGGMKRRLSVGMALCGSPKVVLLDEPSTGVDPAARHALWDFLHEEKQDKTILLSTHYMNEADVLGDRIAILAAGKLIASGSPFFLKNEFGVGYRLVCVKGRKYSETCLLELLRKHIPSVVVDSESSSEVQILLAKKYIQSFEPMLKQLESNIESCGIMSYGVSYTTLEEVFMKAGTNSHLQTSDDGNVPTEDTVQLEHRPVTKPHSPLIGSNVLQSGVISQIKAQVLKKFLCTKRSWMKFCWQTFIVLIVIMIFAFPEQLGTLIIPLDSLPSLKISLGTYKSSLNVLERMHNLSDVELEYRRLFRNDQQLEIIDGDIEPYILNKFNHSILEYNSRMLVGASFSNGSYTGWYNAKDFHSAPLALNLIFNSILHTVCPSCSITPINHPLPRAVKSNGGPIDNPDHFKIPVLVIVIIMLRITSYKVTFYIWERTSRVKLLQVVGGLKTELYWLVNFIWDLMVFKLSCLVILVMLFGYQIDGWSNPQSLATLLFIFFIFALAALPMIYLFSFWISNPASGSRVHLIFGIGPICLWLLKLQLTNNKFNKLADLIGYGSMVIPTTSLYLALDKFNNYTTTKTTCKSAIDLNPNCIMDKLCESQPKCFSSCSDLFSFSTNGMLKELCFMIATGIICFLLVWSIEHKLFFRLWSKVNPTKGYLYTIFPHMDSDVLLENNRVSQMTDSDIGAQSLVLRNLTKNFGTISAVQWLSLGTNHSECFGLLGVNGAGKTTALRMMTGDETFSFGDVWINGVSVKSNLSGVYQHVGYCPQFDGLLDELTGLETLRIFAMLRGIAGSEISAAVQSLAEELGLTKYLNKPVQEYSGGMKRKLSTALALIGSPSVIFLDEPTSGMDPAAKRQVWNMINRMRDAGKTIILSTHSMDECEALCTRLAIMVGGEFKCLGSTQHLKNKFSGGFLLHIKMVPGPGKNELQLRSAAVKVFVAERFRDAVLKDDLQNSLSYHIPRSDLTWSAMFGIMETSKEVLGIEEYSLGQTTLEQVFLVFANNDYQ